MVEPDRVSVSRSDLMGYGRRYALLTGALFAYCGTIYWIYVTRVISFIYLGYTYKEPNWGYLVLSAIMLSMMAMMLPRKISSASSFVLWMLFVLVVVPGAQISLYTTYLSPEAGLFAAFALIVSFGLARLITVRKTHPDFRRFALSPRVFWIIIGIFSLAVYVVIGVTMGLELRFVGILDVYDIRDEYGAKLASSGVLVSYLVGTQSNVINPLVIIRGITSRNYWLVFLGAFGQALLFSLTGFKTVLFSVPAIILLSFIFFVRRGTKGFHFGGKPRSIVLLWAPTAMLVACTVLDALMNSIVWTSFFGRRLIATPGLMTGLYVEYYSENPLAFLAHSVLSPWVDTQYALPPANTVGLWVTGSAETAMNAHLFADGFANFGWAGMAGAAIVLGIYLRFVDGVSGGLPPAVSALLLLMLAITLSNTSILTAMFSHGLVAAFLVLAVAPRSGWEPSPDRRPLRRFLAGIKARRAETLVT